jgi:ribosome-associated protein
MENPETTDTEATKREPSIAVPMNTVQKAALAAKLGDDLKAEDILILDVRKICNFTDYFVIVTCASSLQLRALAARVLRTFRDRGVRALSSSGQTGSAWHAVDFGDFVLHVFTTDARNYYRLDKLWADGKKIDWRKHIE